MSWLSDIAGKAEDILNKMDQKAAVALGSNEKSRKLDYNEEITDQSYNYSGSRNFTISNPSSSLHSRSSSLSSSFSTISTKEFNNNGNGKSDTGRDDDEKLFEFLNSKDCSVADSTPFSNSPKNELIEDKPNEEKFERIERISSKLDMISEVGVNENPDSEKDSNNKLLAQIESLTKEISQVTKKNIELEIDCKRLQRRLDNWQSQISSSDSAFRELQSREADLKATIDAKDSQLAVLRVRLDERDEQLKEKEAIMQRLQVENDTLINEREKKNSTYDVNIDSMRERIRVLEKRLLTEKEMQREIQQETLTEMAKYQENQQQLSEEFANLQRLFQAEKNSCKELKKQLSTMQANHEALENDFEEYKARAQRTLQSKEELIKALQSESGHIDQREDLSKLNKVLQSQCDNLILEIEELRNKNDHFRKENDQIKHEQIYQLNQKINSLTEELYEEKRSKADLELELRQIQDELKYFQDDLNQTKNSLTSRIKDRDAEIERLRKQLVSKRSSSNGNTIEELEIRVKNLTANLIQKQTYVEQLSSEKHSLALQYERVNAKLRETMETINNQSTPGSVSIGMVHSTSASNLVNRIRPLVEESPFDGQVTRRVKRAYGWIDAFSIRLGVFLRLYPSARAFVILYILVMHIWVVFILFNYRPTLNE